MQKLHGFIIALLALMTFVLSNPLALGAMPVEWEKQNITAEAFFIPGGPTYQISGRITENGVNLPNITVRLAVSNTPNTPIQTVSTGADGRYTFTNVAVGTYVVRPESVAYAFMPESRPVSIFTMSANNVDFTAIFREYDVDGNIVLADEGTPLSDIAVRLFRLPNTTTPIENVLTDTQGRYVFSDVTPGNYRITPQSSIYTFQPIFLEFSVVNAPITLSDFEGNIITYDITGRVSDNGTGMAEVTLTLATQTEPETVLQTITTNGNGDYTFADMEPDTYRITPRLKDYLMVPDYRDVPVTSGDVEEINFEANVDVFSVSGRITDFDSGLPLSQVQVRLSLQSDPETPIAFAGTNSNGEYAFLGVDPGDYRVTPDRNGYEFTPANRNFTISNANVSGLDFTASRLTYSASGRVEENGEPLAGVTVTLSIATTGEVRGVDVTDANGDYSFAALAPSDVPYRVTPTRFPYGFTPPYRDFTITIQSGNVPNLNFDATISFLYLPLAQRAAAPPPPPPTPSPTAIPCLVEINPNDNLEDAESNAFFAPDRCINGALPSPDVNDFYKIQFGGGAFRASLNGLAEGTDYDLTLYEVVDGNAVLMGVSNNPGNQNETLNLPTLEAGVYFIGVQSFTGNSPILYTLRWTQP